MSQERADLNWYHKPPDYFASRAERTGVQSAQRPAGETAHSLKGGPTHETEAGEFTFDDFIDIINPLHHLPVISALYREATGDQISGHARIIGGGIFGGGAGFVAAAVNAISEEATGRDLGGNLAAAVLGDDAAPIEAAQPADHADRQLASTAPDAGRSEATAAPVSAPDVPVPDVPVPDVPALKLPAPASTSPALEGQAALDALYADLAGQSGATAPPPPVFPAQAPPSPNGTLRATTPDSPPPPTTVLGRAGQVAPARVPPNEPDPAATAAGHKHEPEHGFTSQMLEGLKKYQDMMTGRQLSFAYDYRKTSPAH